MSALPPAGAHVANGAGPGTPMPRVLSCGRTSTSDAPASEKNAMFTTPMTTPRAAASSSCTRPAAASPLHRCRKAHHSIQPSQMPSYLRTFYAVGAPRGLPITIDMRPPSPLYIQRTLEAETTMAHILVAIFCSTCIAGASSIIHAHRPVCQLDHDTALGQKSA